ncbi:hypothetical protein FBU30_003818 [Linnemannia zychae]|nr:hypothetical protein FBU30_003818 [Linnemannia zychae]
MTSMYYFDIGNAAGADGKDLVAPPPSDRYHMNKEHMLNTENWSNPSSNSSLETSGATSIPCMPCSCFLGSRAIYNLASIYPSPELSDLDDFVICSSISSFQDNEQYGQKNLSKRRSLDASPIIDDRHTKRTRPSFSTCQHDPSFDYFDGDNDHVGSITNSAIPITNSPSHSFTALDSPPYYPADVFPDNNKEWHQQNVEYNWASSTSGDEYKTNFFDNSYWPGIDYQNETLNGLEVRHGHSIKNSHCQSEDFPEPDQVTSPKDTPWHKPLSLSNSQYHHDNSPPYIPVDYNTFNSDMDPDEDRYFEQLVVKYDNAGSLESCSYDGDISDIESLLSGNDF